MAATPSSLSGTTQNNLIAYWKAYLSPSPNRRYLLFGIVEKLATTFKDKKAILELNRVWNDCEGLGYPLGLVERIETRDMFNPMSKTYRFKAPTGFSANNLYSFSNKPPILLLGDLSKALANAERKLWRIFAELCAKNDIPENFNLGMLEITKDSGLPIIK